MEKRIILFLVLSMAVIVLYPYLLEKLGLAKRLAPAAPRAVAPKKDTAAPATVTAPATPSPQILPTPAPSARVPTPATEGREQEATVETDLVKVGLDRRLLFAPLSGRCRHPGRRGGGRQDLRGRRGRCRHRSRGGGVLLGGNGPGRR